jgi:hypothetical protein
VPSDERLKLTCSKCGGVNTFDQPYAYHAGFSDIAFLYSDSGHFTLVWNTYDQESERFFSGESFSSLSAGTRARFENALRDAPDGGRWKFDNPARCIHCSEPIAGPMKEQIYCLIYPGSIVTTLGGPLQLKSQLK